MAMQNFVLDLIEALLNDKELGLSENDIRFYDKGVTVDEEDKDMDAHIRWQNARRFNEDSNIVRSSLLIVQVAAGTGEQYISFHMGDLYRVYRTDGMEKALQKVRSVLLDMKRSAVQTAVLLEQFGDYSQIRDHLILRPLNYDLNEKVLANAVYLRTGDIARVLYVSMGKSGSKLLSSIVKRDLFRIWNVPEEEALQWALENTMRLQPPVLHIPLNFSMNPDDIKTKELHFMEGDVQRIDFDNLPYTILTTDQQINGAISLFYPGVLERLYQMAGGNFYILFGSIHDIHIHPAGGRFKLSSMRSTLADMNRELNQREEILTRKIYLYDGDTKTLSAAE